MWAYLSVGSRHTTSHVIDQGHLNWRQHGSNWHYELYYYNFTDRHVSFSFHFSKYCLCCFGFFKCKWFQIALLEKEYVSSSAINLFCQFVLFQYVCFGKDLCMMSPGVVRDLMDVDGDVCFSYFWYKSNASSSKDVLNHMPKYIIRLMAPVYEYGSSVFNLLVLHFVLLLMCGFDIQHKTIKQ